MPWLILIAVLGVAFASRKRAPSVNCVELISDAIEAHVLTLFAIEPVQGSVSIPGFEAWADCVPHEREGCRPLLEQAVKNLLAEGRKPELVKALTWVRDHAVTPEIAGAARRALECLGAA